LTEKNILGRTTDVPPPVVYYTKMIEKEYEPKRYDKLGELIQDSDGTWVSGWYTVEDADGNTYPVKDRD